MRIVLLSCALLLTACRDEASGAGGGTRTAITAVGSSTVYPFTTLVAERFVAADPQASAPVIESTGTGAGMKLFCAGIGADHPDIEDASRRMRRSEYRQCHHNGGGGVLEIPVGLDGVAFAAANDGPRLALSVVDLFRALAATPDGRANTAKTWHDVNARLPAIPIQIYGPPATSGTRDALAELILARGCEIADPGMAALAIRDPAAHAVRCTRIREDGAYVDTGENDNFVVQKLAGNPQAIGVFGYSYLEENAGSVHGVAIDGVMPSYATIADGRYPGSRLLYLYVKTAHLNAVPGLRSFLRLYAANWVPGGALVRRGLIAAPAAVRIAAARTIATEMPLDPLTLPE